MYKVHRPKANDIESIASNYFGTNNYYCGITSQFFAYYCINWEVFKAYFPHKSNSHPELTFNIDITFVIIIIIKSYILVVVKGWYKLALKPRGIV